MMSFRSIALAACAASLVAACPGAAATADSTGTLYVLVTPPSALEVGCQGPCECPVTIQDTYGSFALVPAGVDPLYANYSVQRFIASFNNGPGAVAITGSGHYRIGGEVALVQQLVLDLDVEGMPTQRFDSGLVPVGAPFPQITVSCAVHGFACLDSVLVVSAKPAAQAGATSPPGSPALESARPNPFRGRTDISFTLDRAGTAELEVVDLAGRRVRTLVAAQTLDAGPRTVTWEGVRDDGRRAPAGVYWIVLRTPGGIERRRIVKLD